MGQSALEEGAVLDREAQRMAPRRRSLISVAFSELFSRLQQYGKVIRDNKKRLNMAEQLEDCPAACFLGSRLVHLRQVELKRLVAPMLHFRLVEQLLIEACEQAQAAGRSLKDFLHEGPGQELRLEIVAACESPHQAGERGVFRPVSAGGAATGGVRRASSSAT